MRRWPLWQLQPRLRGYVLAVITAGVVATAIAAALTRWRASDAVMFGCLLVFGAVSVEAVRRIGEPAGSIKDAHGVWELATALLLPPFFALTAPVVVFALTQWRVRRSLAYRRVFSAAAIGLSYGAASLAFHAVWRRSALQLTNRAGLVEWVLLALGCAVLRWMVNTVLVSSAVKLDDLTVRVRDLLGGTDGLYNDAAEACLGALVAFVAAATPVLLVLALPCGTLLQRSARHSQLVQASRTDPKTGLLTAVAWQHEAAVQITRALRTRTPLAVAMVDIDHFKQVNDTHGHLAGDSVLADVATALSGGLREYDLAGRFGGEEFCLLLPTADAAEAVRVAERLRLILSHITVPAHTADGRQPSITVSIGVSVLGPGISDLTDLLAAADAALYRAKNAGRNTVRLAAGPQPERAA
jgi:diguanylate cyclase (GGDEF)-like protein